MKRPAARLLGWAGAWTAAAVLLAVSGWTYADTRGDGALSYGKARDAVLAAGQREIARLNTVDGGHVDSDLDGWLDATTGRVAQGLRHLHPRLGHRRGGHRTRHPGRHRPAHRHRAGTGDPGVRDRHHRPQTLRGDLVP
jgi:hypothetical protein